MSTEGEELIVPERTRTSAGKELRREQIIMFVLANPDLSYAQIGLVFGCTGQNISQIMTSPDAKEVIRIARERLREHLLAGVEDQLDAATQLALKCVKRTLEADISATHKAKANQDRVAVKVLQGRGLLKVGGPGEGKNGFQVSPEMFQRLESALAKADLAQEIDPFEGIPVVEAEVVSLKEDDAA